MAATIDPVQSHALNHYVLTGQTHFLNSDGARGEYDTPSEGTPNEVERWRKQARCPTESPVEPRSLPTDSAGCRPIPRRRSTGGQSPVPSLPTNSRTDVAVPRDIAGWVLSIPLGLRPPEIFPWKSQLTEEESSSADELDEQVIAHAERKFDTDIATALSSTAPTSLPEPSGNVEIYQWRYENYVDWWRQRAPPPQGVVSPPPPINELATNSSPSEAGDIVPVSKPSLSVKNVLALPTPPPIPNMPPEPQVVRVMEIPSAAKSKLGAHVVSKRVYYRLISQTDEPLPVRQISRTNSISPDKSIGVLFLENPNSYRACDLTALLHNRECSPQPNNSPRQSPRLRKKSTGQRSTGPPSPSYGSFAAQQQYLALRTKLKLYYMETINHRFSQATIKRRRLKEHHLLPFGVGADEASALIVKVIPDDSPVPPPLPPNVSTPVKRPRRSGIGKVFVSTRRGVAMAVRGLANSMRSLGDGLGRFADCLSGGPVAKSKTESWKA